MKTSQIFRASACAFAALCLFPACQTTPTSGTSDASQEFDRADANHDGKLSLDEVNDHLVLRIFKSRDANRDGSLTLAEWTTGDEPEQKRNFMKRDTNRDGVVALNEALVYGRKHGMASQVVPEADTDKDGFVSRKEAGAYYAAREVDPR